MKKLFAMMLVASLGIFSLGCEGTTTDTGVDPAPPAVDDGTGTDTDPAATDPAATDPAATDPAATDPAATDPAATDPAASDPAASDPAAAPSP